MSRFRLVALASALAAAMLCAGCSAVPQRTRTPERYDRGLVVVLPGIEGPSVWNRDLILGLDEGGVPYAIERFEWTSNLPGAFVVNLTDLERNRHVAGILAERILAYRALHPGRPVHLVGHSGGAGIAVLSLEALPPGRQIDMAILLAPALSPDYDLTAALLRCRAGVVNFHSPLDAGLLVVGTSILGPIDRRPGAAAGCVGFSPPDGLTDLERDLYRARLRQVEWTPALAQFGANGGHVGWTTVQFAKEYLAPLIRTHQLPAAPAPQE